MHLIEELSEQHIAQLHQLYQQEWWTKGRTLEETELCVSNSQIVLALVDEHDELKAFVRVLTDGVFKALIFDLIICSSCRNLGLGRQLLHAIKQHQRLSRVKHFELYCKPELIPFYEKFGFTDELGDIKLMSCEN